MAGYVYATPEWLAEVDKSYKGDATNVDFLKGRTAEGLTLAWMVKAEPKFGIASDICFVNFLHAGVMVESSRFVPIEEAYKGIGKVEYWLFAATPDIWKRIIEKKDKYITDLMTLVPGQKTIHKVEPLIGDKVRIVSFAPYADKIVENYNRVQTVWPDEMSPTELGKHKAYVAEFKRKLGI